jgi:hypothetical protein
VLRQKLNHDFVANNTININYPLPLDGTYQALLKTLYGLAAREVFEIVPVGNAGQYERGSAVRFGVGMPRFLACNAAVYSVSVDRYRYYLLPDCVLLSDGHNYRQLSWSNVSLRITHLRGNLKTKMYRTVMTHGRIRNDGGFDRRFNTQFAQVAYWGWQPFSHSGMCLTFGKDVCLALID